jgi:hypothetical protein
MREAQKEFATHLYLNVAEGHVEKAGKLKTAKSQLKYLDLAAEVIQEGLDAGKGDQAALANALAGIEKRREKTASGNT